MAEVAVLLTGGQASKDMIQWEADPGNLTSCSPHGMPFA